VSLNANWAAELGKLLLEFENTVSSIHHEKLLKGCALFVLAVAEPVQAVVYLSVPGRLIFPVHLFNVTQQIEAEVDAYR